MPRTANPTDASDLERALGTHRVRLAPKRGSRVMRAAALLLRAIGSRDFMDRYWTTVGRTVYYPSCVADPRAHPDVLEHELVHVRQWERWGVWLWVSYLLLPLPFGLAWFRFRWEREAYLVQIERAEDRAREIERVVNALWYGYGFPWPRAWMRRWFERAATPADDG
jgi:hypothetical protein